LRGEPIWVKKLSYLLNILKFKDHLKIWGLKTMTTVVKSAFENGPTSQNFPLFFKLGPPQNKNVFDEESKLSGGVRG
jgi:hypothetical protein